MKILMTGVTGFLGRKISADLKKAQHEVVGLSRNPASNSPYALFKWDGLKGEPPLEAYKDVDAIIHLAGEGIADSRWTKERKQILFDSRITTTKNLIAGLSRSGQKIKIFISASAIGIYPSSSDIQDEDSPLGTGFLADLCKEWEAAAHIEGARTLHLRIPPVIGHGGGFLKQVEPIFKKGLGAALGPGTQGFSFIALDDLSSLVSKALSNANCKGAINVCAPHPITNGQMTHILAEHLGVRVLPLNAPAFALKIMYGEMADVLLMDQRIVSKILKPEDFKSKTFIQALTNA